MPRKHEDEVDEELAEADAASNSGSEIDAKGNGVRFGKAQFAYDPDQDPEEKRAVRRNYRALNHDYDGTSMALLKYKVLMSN
jgi:hypothetical protein